MSKKRKTNVELVKHMMTFSRYGALSQIFIMDAIGKAARNVANAPIEEVRAAFEKSGAVAMFNPDAWHGVAKEIAERLDRA